MGVNAVKIEFDESDTIDSRGRRYLIRVEPKARGSTVKPIFDVEPAVTVKGKKVPVENIY